MSKKLLLVILMLVATVGLYLWSARSLTRQAEKIYRIGIVVRGASYRPGVEGFKTKMAALGYEEGKNVHYETRFVEKKEELAGVIAGLLAKGVDLLHTYSTPATVEAYRQTKDVPIVFGSMGDPLASKTIKSLERSETNVTGVNSLSSPLAAKRLEFLVEAVATIKKVAMPFTPDDIPGRSSYNAAIEAAKKLGVEIISYDISKERDVKATAQAILHKDVDGIVISSDSVVWANLETYVAQALEEKLPFAVFDKDMVARGGLLGYGPDYAISGEQAAVLADKILKGQPPTDLPIETPQRIILAVNVKTARALGLTLPKTFLEKADVIITE